MYTIFNYLSNVCGLNCLKNQAISKLLKIHKNNLNISIKKRVVRIDQKQDPTIYFLSEIHFNNKDLCNLKGKQ